MGKILSIIFIFLSLHLNATNYYVDDGSNVGDIWTPLAIGNDANNGKTTLLPKATIAGILSTYALNPSDTIFVDSGTYGETGITIGVNDDGSVGKYVVVKGAGKTLTIFSNTVTTEHTFKFSNNNTKYVKIINLKVFSGVSSSYSSINFSGSGINNIWVDNCEITSNQNRGAVFGNNNTLTACDHITFNNCIVGNSKTSTSGNASGFEFDNNFNNITISNCIITCEGTTSGIYFQPSTTYNISGINVNNNTINMNHATSASVRSINLKGGITSNIYSNVIVNKSISSSVIAINLEGIDATHNPNNINLYSNTITSFGTGVYLYGYGNSSPVTNINIYFNTIIIGAITSGHTGIKTNNAGNSSAPIKIYQNKIIKGIYGIYLYGTTTYTSVYNNYISNSVNPFYSNTDVNTNNTLIFNSFYGSNGCYIYDNTVGWTIKNNIFQTTASTVSNLYYALKFTITPSAIDYNCYFTAGANIGVVNSTQYNTIAGWKSVVGEINSQNGDPKFDDPINNDLNISINATTSKVSNRGVVMTGYSNDIYNTTRNTVNPYIGAYEGIFTLPIELISFKVQQENNYNLIQWSTSSEINNNFFTLERGNSDFNFEPITIIMGKGNSNVLSNYLYKDYDLLTETYYRLKQTDFDGKYTYSNIIYISKQPEYYYNVKIFTENATGDILLQTTLLEQKNNVSVKLYNLQGNEVYSNLINIPAGLSTIRLTPINTTKSIYVVYLNDNDNTIAYSKIIYLN